MRTTCVLVFPVCCFLALAGCSRSGAGTTTAADNKPRADGAAPEVPTDASNRPREAVPASAPEPVMTTVAAWTTRETVVLTAARAMLVVPNSFRVSPDGRRYGYVLNQGGGHVAVIDGIEDTTVYQQVADIRFSGDGKDVAVAGIVRGSQTAGRLKYEGPLPAVVLNGKRFTPQVSYQDSGAVRSIPVQPPELLAVAGGRVLYTCQAVPDPRGDAAEFVYADDTPLTKRDRFTGPAALVGQLKGRAAFARRDVRRTVWKQVGVVAGTPDAVFSPNGTAWATVYRVNQDDEVSVNGELRKKFPKVSGFTFSPDGTRHAYFAERPEARKSYLVVDGGVSENPGGPGVGFAFSPDGSRWAAQTTTRVIVDGVPQKVYSAIAGTSRFGNATTEGVPSVAFSPDGKHVAYLASRTTRRQPDGKEAHDPHAFLVVDGREVKEWAAAGGQLFWSADNRTLGYVATPPGGKQPVVVVGDQTWPAFDEITPLGFSPDGRSFAARVRHMEQQSVVLDGQRRGLYEEISLSDTRVGFTPSGAVTYFARKADNSVVWVQERRTDLPDDGGQPAAVAPKADAPKAGGWVPLFNDRDLSNWTFPERSEYPLYDPRPANKVKWAVADGAITFTGKDHSHLETVGQGFRRFHLRVEAKTSPGGHVRLEFGKRFVQDVRVSIDNTRPKWRTGSMADKINPTGDGVTDSLAKDNEWFTLEVLATGDRTVTRVNGKRAAEFKSPGLPEGPIRFFVDHDYPAPVFVRKVEYRLLADEAELDRPGDLRTPDPEQVSAAADPLLTPVEGFTPLFNGKDATGWVTDRQGKAWEVRDGRLFASNRTHTLLFSDKDYRNFHLRAVVRLAVGARGEILVRANQPKLYGCRYYGVHLDNALRADRPTGTMTWSSGNSNYKLKGGSGGAEDGKWTLVEVIAQGRRVVTKVDGKVVTEYQHDPVEVSGGRVVDSALLEGRIGLRYDGRSDGSPIEIARVDIKELK